MSKALLNSALAGAKIDGKYNWSLYFIKLGRSKQRYTAYKCKFKKETYLYEYVAKLLETVEKFNVEPVANVEEYNAINTKISCDRIDVTDAKIAENWNKFTTSIVKPSTQKLQGNSHFYVLSAEPTQGNEDMPSISFIKFANPITKLETKKSILFKSTKNEDEFEEISDDVLRLYLTVDCIYISGELYCFNHAFEKPFGLEETVKIAKKQAIDLIVGKDFITDSKIFEDAAKSYNARTFLSIDDGRLQSLVDIEKRKGYAQWQGIELDGNDKLILTTEKQANEIIKYICLKIIREYDTDATYEISNAVKINSSTH